MNEIIAKGNIDSPNGEHALVQQPKAGLPFHRLLHNSPSTTSATVAD
jgi:hypothetical protein